MAKTTTTFPARVRNRWFDTSTVGTLVFAENLTKQEFKDECDINLIVGRYGPQATWSNPPTLRFGDFADVPDFLAAQLLVKQAEDAFLALPAQVRDRFRHDPVELLRFVHDPANLDEARKLGLAAPAPPAPPPAPEAPKP